MEETRMQEFGGGCDKGFDKRFSESFLFSSMHWNREPRQDEDEDEDESTPKEKEKEEEEDLGR
jgi:hypothetical protein